MTTETAIRVLSILEQEYSHWHAPIVEFEKESAGNALRILISTILSSRTKDAVTSRATARLFDSAATLSQLAELTSEEIDSLIAPVGFHRTKSKQIKDLITILMNKFDGKVPSKREHLMSLPGVGRKTANLVLWRAFNIPAICVDTHVHRIVNRWGLVATSTPLQTEERLMSVLPEELWGRVNRLLVAFGQTICHPVSPLCSQCPIKEDCSRIGVIRHR